MPIYFGRKEVSQIVKNEKKLPAFVGNKPIVTGGLGPSSITVTVGTPMDTLAATITGLAADESIESFSPNDGRFALDFNQKNLLIGSSALSAGTFTLSFVTTTGRTFSILVTAIASPTSNYFVDTPMTLGRDANSTAKITNGHYILKTSAGNGNIAGSWNVNGRFIPGQNYRVIGTLRAVNNSTNQTYTPNVRVLFRSGSNVDLTSVTGGTATDIVDKTFSGTVYIDAIFTYKGDQPNIGIYGASFPGGVRLEFTDMEITETTVLANPWSVLPTKAEKTLALNDVYVPINTVGPTVYIPPGATKAHFKLTYLAATVPTYGYEVRTTARIEVVTQTTGQVGFNATTDTVPPPYSLYWRSGDDADLWVTIDIVNPKTEVGNKFRVAMSTDGLAGPIAFFVEVKEGAVNELPATLPYHRPPYKIDFTGVTPTRDLDMTTVEWSDTGFRNDVQAQGSVWRTHPSHARSNFSANGENGLYTDSVFDPVNAITPHSREVDSKGRPFVRLHSDRFVNPVTYNGLQFQYQASMLQGQRLSEWHYRRGIYRAQIVVPSIRGGWAAWWTVGVRLSKQSNLWPPEIDFMENFNQAFNDPYNQYDTNSGQHAGPHGVGRQRVDSGNTNLQKLGWDSSLNLWTQIHDWVCVIEKDWVTHFIDGVETFRNRNISEPADGSLDWAFYPIINVAVRASDEYVTGTKDLLWYGMQYYAPEKVPAFGFKTDPKPWPLVVPAEPDIRFSIGGSSSNSTNGSNAGMVVSRDWTFEDDFNRADENLDANPNYLLLTGLPGQIKVTSNELSILTTSAANQTIVVPAVSKGVSQTNQQMRGVWKHTTSDRAGWVLRATDTNNFVWLRLLNGVYTIWKCVNGAFTIMASASTANAPSGFDVLDFQVIGQVVKLFRNGNLAATATLDAGQLTSGHAGIIARGTATVPVFDDLKWGTAI